MTRDGSPAVGFATVSGVFIMYPPYGGVSLRSAAFALASALTQVGIEAVAGPMPGTSGFAADALSVIVGTKSLKPPGGEKAERQPCPPSHRPQPPLERKPYAVAGTT